MEILRNLDKLGIEMKEWKFNREEIYEDLFCYRNKS